MANVSARATMAMPIATVTGSSTGRRPTVAHRSAGSAGLVAAATSAGARSLHRHLASRVQVPVGVEPLLHEQRPLAAVELGPRMALQQARWDDHVALVLHADQRAAGLRC